MEPCSAACSAVESALAPDGASPGQHRAAAALAHGTLDSAVRAAHNQFNCNLTLPQPQELGTRQTYKSQTQLEHYYGPLDQTVVNEMYRNDLELHAALVA